MNRKLDLELLARLRREGKTYQQIADTAGCAIATVSYNLARLGLPAKKPGPVRILDSDPEKRRWFIRNFPDFSNTTIAIYLGCSVDSVQRLALHLGLEKSEQYISALNAHRAEALRKAVEVRKAKAKAKAKGRKGKAKSKR